MTAALTGEQLVAEYQCPGCVAGPDPTSCPAYRPSANAGQVGCDGHVPGTSTIYGRFMLGMPKGFDKVGALQDGQTTPVRIWTTNEPTPAWNYLNVPVWAWDDPDTGTRFVRTFLPRLNIGLVDVFPDGADNPWPTALEPATSEYAGDTVGAMDVARFRDEID